MVEGIKRLIEILGLDEFKYDKVTQEKLEKTKQPGKYVPLARLHPIDFTDAAERCMKQLMTAREELGIIRQDLLLDLHALATRSKEDVEVFKDLEEVLKPKYYEALLWANTIKELEDRDLADKSQKLYKKFEIYYKGYGPKIYNWNRTNYIRSLFHFTLQMYKWMFENTYKERYDEFLEQQLKFFEDSIWLDQFMTSSTIMENLKKRLDIRKQKSVKVFARGDTLIEKAEKVCADFVTFRKNLDMNKPYYYKIGINRCACIIITKKQI